MPRRMWAHFRMIVFVHYGPLLDKGANGEDEHEPGQGGGLDNDEDDDLPEGISSNGNPEEFFFNNMKEDAASDLDFVSDSSVVPLRS